MYSDFSLVYDTLMSDVDYPVRTKYILSLFERFDKIPSLILDLACGTGGFSNELAQNGIDVIGVDISEDMLSVARENSAERSLEILYLCQPAEELDLYGTVDGAVCCLDSLNHITDYGNFCKAIERVALFLEKDRLFIFDVNTLYKHKEILGNNTFVIEEENLYCVWQNQFDDTSNITEINLDFFFKEDELYDRFSEVINERAYTDNEIRKALEAAGFKVEGVLGELAYNSPGDEAERVFYIARKDI